MHHPCSHPRQGKEDLCPSSSIMRNGFQEFSSFQDYTWGELFPHKKFGVLFGWGWVLEAKQCGPLHVWREQWWLILREHSLHHQTLRYLFKHRDFVSRRESHFIISHQKVDRGLITLGGFKTFLENMIAKRLFFFILHLKPSIYFSLTLSFQMLVCWFFLFSSSFMVKTWFLVQN